MSSNNYEKLPVPGATLSYTVRGSGPLLLMIAGGGGIAETFKQVAEHLAERYTVVTYDRRGAARSLPDNPDEEVSLEMHSDDAHHLLAQLAHEPAYVFGSSAGALIGLDLAARYGKQVRTLVAHEPPARYLLPAPDPAHEGLLASYQREGAASALRQFAAQIGVNYQDLEPGVQIPSQSARSNADSESFFKYTFPAVQRYRLDIPALLASSTRIVIAGGSAGRDYLGYHCAVAVAERLGTTVVEFPSHHAGYVSHPRAFAERLREVLDEASHL